MFSSNRNHIGRHVAGGVLISSTVDLQRTSSVQRAMVVVTECFQELIRPRMRFLGDIETIVAAMAVLLQTCTAASMTEVRRDWHPCPAEQSFWQASSGPTYHRVGLGATFIHQAMPLWSISIRPAAQHLPSQHHHAVGGEVMQRTVSQSLESPDEIAMRASITSPSWESSNKLSASCAGSTAAG